MNKLTSIFFGLTILLVPTLAYSDQIVITASKDTFLRNGAPNTNEGANAKLNVRKAGKRRAVVAFDLSTLQTALIGGSVSSAVLQLTITNNLQNWSKKGRLIGAHRILVDWTEGNGSNAKFKAGESDNGNSDTQGKNRGSGSGATWKCATDSNVKNTKPDCSSRWNGGNYASTATGTATIKDSTTGVVEIDVTSDVQSFVNSTAQNYGWLIKKSLQEKAGSVWFASKEATTGNPTLLVTYSPGS